MPKKGASKAKKKDQWPDDEDTEQQLTENMKKLMSDVSYVVMYAWLRTQLGWEPVNSLHGQLVTP